MDKAPGIEYLGKYKVNKTIGYGSMGVVYECIDPQFQRMVAVKVLHSHLLDSVKSDEYLQRFKNEIIASGSLSHPNIVTVYDADFMARPPYLVMEFVEGIELTSLIQDAEHIEYDRAYTIILDILRGLKEIHNAGIIHRDLKPSNIFITKDNIAKIADFGVARVEGSELTQIGDVIGSPKYMSPEQCMGKTLDLRSDIFTVGAIFFELLTGESCFSGNSYTVVANKIVSEPAPVPSKFDPALKIFDQVVRKALAKDPDERFQSAAEFIAEIEDLSSTVLYHKTVRMSRIGRDGGTGTRSSTVVFNKHWSLYGKWIIAGACMLVLVAVPIFLFNKYHIQIIPVDDSGNSANHRLNTTTDVTTQAQSPQERTSTENSGRDVSKITVVDSPGNTDPGNKQDERIAANQIISKPPINDSTQIDLTKKEKIWRLLSIADTYLNLERLMSPKGSNALDTYKAILSIEPSNERALAGVDNVKKLVVKQIQEDIDQHNLGFAKEMLELARKTFPQDPSWTYFEVKLGMNVVEQ